ncbi:MAG: M1 family metallopeptidase [Flavobacteriales bacterium]|nr:M1 family metallopeptidase [Flavobacteriales bacterium]
MKYQLAALLAFVTYYSFAQEGSPDKFRQLYDKLPTPNTYRTASGAPGHEYWQQRADYVMEISLDEENNVIYGEEVITYYNNSPDPLDYLWVQLDQNRRSLDSDSYKTSQSELKSKYSLKSLQNLTPWFDGGFKIDFVQDTKGNDLDHSIIKTMMRIDLDKPLVPNGAVSFKIKWHYNINERAKLGGRSGYEYFENENNSIYVIAQFYPRMAVYIDNEGWQNKQFLGSGEFTLTFGNYDVKLTVPADHVVASTGELQNAKEILAPKHLDRLEKAKTADQPVEIVTQAEAEEAEKGRSKGTKTWHYKAENVRDFGWASSRKFIWDAQGVPLKERTVMAMSYYPKEANPLWGDYSTKTVKHTVETYSKYTFDYPYPVAISVNAASIGMEYPMICFNFGRCEEDGTYTERTKYGVISVIIHEVGHNWFPMIVNSDERQWTWMDEGLNTYLQYLSEQEFQRGYPSRRGEPRKIVDYMKGDQSNISPIMTNSESVHQLGNNAYGKPATGLNILRETVVGREQFDFAFKTYSNRWKFKHPSPADFFRSIEDATAIDLDWFWRGWFYGTDNVDIGIDYVKYAQPASFEAGGIKVAASNAKESEAPSISTMRNAEDIPLTYADRDTTLKDFYYHYDENEVSDGDREKFDKIKNALSKEEKAMMQDQRHFYEIAFTNHGGMVMPLIVEFTFADGEKEIQQIPAEIWRRGDTQVKKVFVTDRQATNIVLDPYLQTADVDLSNNSWPAQDVPSRFEIYKKKQEASKPNPMQQAK